MTDEPATREAARLSALARYDVLDTPREPVFDEVAELAAAICRVPIAVVNFIGDQRQFFMAEVGLGVRETPFDSSFCAKALLEEDFLHVPDATQDHRFDCNPLVTGEPHLRFYAGALLKSPEGLPIGTVCVLDHSARTLDATQQQALRTLARQVMTTLELRRTAKQADADRKRHRAIMDSANDFAIIVTDADGAITDWSAGAQSVFGWSEAEMVGTHASRIFTRDDQAAGVPEREMAGALEDGRAIDERWHVRKDDSRFWASGEMSPLRDEAGNRVGFVKVLRDRTEQHRQAEALAAAERGLRQAQAAGGVGVFEVGRDGILHGTPEFCSLYGLEACEAIPARDFEALIIPDDRHLVSDLTSRAAGTAPLDVEYRIRRADDGALRWIARRGEIRRDAAGGPIGFAGIALDITERVSAREALAAERERLRELNATLEQRVAETAADLDRVWHNASDMFVVINAHGRFQRVNPATTAILGWSADELIAKAVFDFVHPDDMAATLGALEHARDEALPTFENRYRAKSGDYRTISWVASPEGDLIYAYGRDISLEKERQAELEIAQAALRQAQKMEAVGQLTGGLAHDFNNLLTGMMGNLELLQLRIARGRHDDIDLLINAAQGAGRRAAALTQRLLAFSRRQTLDPKPTDVNRLIFGLEEMLHRTVGATAEIEIVGAVGLWTAEIDAGQLENAIINLCINGRDAMPDGGKLTIETANKWVDDKIGRDRDLPPGQYISLCVTDTGSGMSAATIERAFEPFFTTKPIGQGTGLGLSMIYGFAKQSGGQVRIYSEVGQGTTVCIYLPRHHGDAEVTEEGQATALASGAGAQTVLVVDDEATIRHLIDEVLDELGYTVIGAGDGAAGLKVLQSGARIELLITDVGLPNGMNGRQVADEARRLRPGLKILFITGFAENAAVGNGHLEPGMELLTKPFTLEALTTKVAEMLSRP